VTAGTPVITYSGSAAIPFRSEDSGVGAHVMSTLGMAVVLLAGLWMGALYARRRGWLTRWIPAASDIPLQPRLQLVGRLRLSAKTVVYEVVSADKQRVLVTESASGVQMLPLPSSREDAP
jgi:hypothetical protein